MNPLEVIAKKYCEEKRCQPWPYSFTQEQWLFLKGFRRIIQEQYDYPDSDSPAFCAGKKAATEYKQSLENKHNLPLDV